jgi:hypothetical protein
MSDTQKDAPDVTINGVMFTSHIRCRDGIEWGFQRKYDALDIRNIGLDILRSEYDLSLAAAYIAIAGDRQGLNIRVSSGRMAALLDEKYLPTSPPKYDGTWVDEAFTEHEQEQTS